MRLVFVAVILVSSAIGQVVITNTGSTNTVGMTVTMQAKGQTAMAESRDARVKMSVPADVHKQLMKDVEAAMPLDQLAVRHCAKSVSFGTSTFVAYKGVRSPDLSCGGQGDPKVVALKKDVDAIMAQAQGKLPSRPRRIMGVR
jgi:hypothetical protein